jgi:hypothetical protein
VHVPGERSTAAANPTPQRVASVHFTPANNDVVSCVGSRCNSESLSDHELGRGTPDSGPGPTGLGPSLILVLRCWLRSFPPGLVFAYCLVSLGLGLLAGSPLW